MTTASAHLLTLTPSPPTDAYDDAVTPEDIVAIGQDIGVVQAHRSQFTSEFYATLFELDPTLRPLFPDDIADQERKLFDELAVLVEHGTAIHDASTRDRFVARAQALGRRHEIYGVEPTMYELVGVALIAALRDVGVGAEHTASWERLYRLVAGSMLDRPATDTS